MRHILTTILAICLSLSAIHAQALHGPWKGVLDLGPSKLNIVFRFEEGKCAMDSPDQGARNIPARIDFMSADSLCIVQEQAGVRYCAHIEDGRIIGRFTQNGMSMPLDLTPGDIVRTRPQTPSEPYPYETEEVSFSSPGATLAGTLVYPVGWTGRKKVPVAVMVTGSGTQNRDEEIFDHKPFLVIADYLARNGIATLRYDDRGAGSSTGDASSATTVDLMGDAAAGVDYLRSKGGFSKVGVIGHSEGGSIAFMLGARDKVDFLVSLAGPGVQGDSILLLQNLNALRKAGYPDMKIPKEMIRTKIKAQGNPWLNHFIDYDPLEDIRKVRCPALVLNGSKDTQVEADVNVPSIESNLPRRRGGKKFVSKYTEIQILPGLNHLFQECGTGQSEEYVLIEETISPEVLSIIAGWINRLK